jgi:hypothetical protein
MQTRVAITPGLWRLLVAAIVALALTVTLGAMSASATKSSSCQVTNTDTGRTFPRLQQAVDAAKPGAHLIVKGTCYGGTFIDKDLAIVGKKTKRSGKPVLDGDNKARVLTIKPTVKVSIRSLVIRKGRASRVPDGGGISNKGRLTLLDVVVGGNWAASRGGAIFNEGVLRVLGASRVKGNGTGTFGLGPAVFNLGHLVLGGSSRIVSNDGSPLANEGTIIMNGASNISRNTAFRVGRTGPTNRGTFMMNDRSSVAEGSGFWNEGALTMNDESSIHHNLRAGPSLQCGGGSLGGGVRNMGSLVMNDASSIRDNIASGGCSGPPYLSRGGGVYNEGTVTMTGASRITGNEAGAAAVGLREPGLGGGLYDASGGILNGVYCAPHTYANVYGNTPDDCYFEP